MFGEPGSTLGLRPDRQGSIAFSATNETKPLFNVAEYWRLALKHRLVIAGALVAAIVIGVVVTFLTTPTYTATTTLQIDREAARVLNNESDVTPREALIQGEEFFQTQYGLLRSRTLAERVADSLALARSDEFLERMGATPPDPTKGTARERAALRREAVIAELRANLGVAPVRGSRLVTVSFESPDPALSAQIINAFAENFIQANLDRKYESASYAREFLEDRIAQTRARLEEAERALVAYATQQQIINLQDGGSSDAPSQSLAANNLSALNSELATARAERVQAEETWRQARATPLLSLSDVINNPAIQRLVEERATLDAQYQQNLRVYREDWPQQLQLRAQIDELNSQINTIASGIRSSIQNRYTVALNRERALQRQVNGLKSDVLDLRDRSIQYNILQREVDTSRSLYDGLLQRYKEVGVTGGIAANNISIVDSAEPPKKPSKPRLLVNLLLAILVGLGLGAVATLLLEALDETLATPDDVESKLGLPVLGVIPLLPRGQSPQNALGDIRSPFSEAYYSLRTALQFSTAEGAPKTLLVTSSRPAEGKSTTAYATALNLARLGRRVLLIDGDLRNPSMHRAIGTDNNAGVSNLLAGETGLDALAKPTSQAGLDFIPCGPLPPNPAELWGSDRVRTLLASAAESYDHIIIDGPPVLGFADAPLVASNVAGTLFVLESRSTRRAQAKGALRRLAMGNSRLLGTVLTKFNTKATQYGGYDYAYDYTYGGQPEPDRKRSR